MLCILCLTRSNDVIHIFDEHGLSLDINGVVVKHFWIKPNPEGANVRIICCSCWNVLNSFHQFYKKVETAHVSLLSASTNIPCEEKLKEENESDDDHFDAYTDFVSASPGVKLELKEDGSFTLPQNDLFTDTEEKLNPLSSSAIIKQSDLDSESDSDSDSEIPLAALAKRKTSASAKDGFLNSDANNSDEQNCIAKEMSIGVSDFEGTKPNVHCKKVLRKIRKSKNKTNSKNEQTRSKRTTIDPAKKRELSKEFDEVIEKNIKLSCSICHVPLANFFLLRKHYNSIHNERGYATCCGRKFRKRGILVDHIYLHLNPEYFKCDKCERILADRRSLEVHMNTHDTSKQRIYQCEECNKSFYRKLLLDRHMYTHIPDRKFTCGNCQKLFSSGYTLRQHINNVHNSDYNKICDQCGKSIRGLEAFRRHQLQHAGVAVPLVQCEKCGVKLKTKYSLKRHMDSMHPESKVLHECKECGKIAPSLAALQRHTSYMHKCERNHKCPMCEKAFKKPGGLKVSDYFLF